MSKSKNPTVNQHFLPITYLKRFGNSFNRIYTLATKVSHPRRKAPFIESKSPKSVCSPPDHFTLVDAKSRERLGVSDPLVIEDKYNAIAENKYGKLLDKLISGQGYLTSEEARDFIFALLSFKQRNPVMRSALIEPDEVRKVLDKRFDELLAMRELIEADLKEGTDFDAFMARLRTELEERFAYPNMANEMQARSIIETYETQGTVVHQVADALLACPWMLLQTALSYPFITSDNPGFSIDPKGQVHNLAFSHSKTFWFPLTPEYVLSILVRPNVDVVLENTIYHQVADSTIVDEINQATFKNSYQEVFSNDETALQRVWQTRSNEVGI